MSKQKKLYEVFTRKHYTTKIQKSILEDHPEARYGNYSLGEDAIFLAKVCYFSKNITFTNDAKYYYFMRPGSLSTKSQYELLRGVYLYLKEIDAFFQDTKDDYALKVSRANAVYILKSNLKKAVNATTVEDKKIYKIAEEYLESISPP